MIDNVPVLFDKVDAAVMVLDSDGLIQVYNPGCQKLLGYPPEAVQACSVLSLLASSEQSLFQSLFSPFKSAAFPLEELVNWHHADGHSVYLLTVCNRWQDYLICTLKETTGALYQQMFNSYAALKLLVDPNTGELVDANLGAAWFYGYSRSTLLTMTLTDLDTRPAAEVAQLLQAMVLAEKGRYEFQHRLADASVRDLAASISLVQFRDRPLLYFVMLDITEKRLLEQALYDSEHRYRTLADTMQQGVSIMDAQTRFLYVNDMYCDFTGYTRQELIGQSVYILLDEAEHSIVYEQVYQRKKGEGGRYEIRWRHKNGDYRYGIIASTPLFDANGDFNGSFNILTDMTHQKLTEQALLKTNAELDAFAHTVAHDLKNPLSVVIGFTDLLQSDFEQMTPDDLRDNLQTIGRTADKMINIIDELLLLAQTRQQNQVLVTPLAMPDIIHEALRRLYYMINQYQAHIIIPDNTVFPAAVGYAPWIEAVWVNYISNAIKYGGVPPRVELNAETLPDGRVCFMVRDNGKGISADKLNRLFIPFERLEDARAEGHGIGLSIVKHIMEKLGGEVRVESQLGRGSTFSFILPAAPISEVFPT
jgi:PAS domain S-box-containing protein